MGSKASDALACPLCTECHRDWHSTARLAGLPTREESMARQWAGVVAALGGSRLAHNVDAETVARRLAAEREAR